MIKQAPISFLIVCALVVGVFAGAFITIREHYRDKLADADHDVAHWKSDSEYWKDQSEHKKAEPTPKNRDNPVPAPKPQVVKSRTHAASLIPEGANVTQATNAPCSQNSIGGSNNQVNCGPPPDLSMSDQQSYEVAKELPARSCNGIKVRLTVNMPTKNTRTVGEHLKSILEGCGGTVDYSEGMILPAVGDTLEPGLFVTQLPPDDLGVVEVLAGALKSAKVIHKPIHVSYPNPKANAIVIIVSRSE